MSKWARDMLGKTEATASKAALLGAKRVRALNVLWSEADRQQRRQLDRLRRVVASRGPLEMRVVAWVNAPSAAVKSSSNSVSEAGGGMVRNLSTMCRMPPWYARSCQGISRRCNGGDSRVERTGTTIFEVLSRPDVSTGGWPWVAFPMKTCPSDRVVYVGSTRVVGTVWGPFKKSDALITWSTVWYEKRAGMAVKLRLATLSDSRETPLIWAAFAKASSLGARNVPLGHLRIDWTRSGWLSR